MSSDQQQPDEPPRVPRPPSKQDLDEISDEQAMIADQWSGPAQPQTPEPAPPKP